MDANKFNKAMLLALTEDIMKVRSYVKKRIPVLTKQVSDSPILEDWRALVEAVGIWLTIFNRRRGNEGFQLLVSRLIDKEKWKKAEMVDFRKSLNPLENHLMQR